jgi:hypothetical protein
MKREKKQWTAMFYFASDNPLAPSIVSQLKALKQAGFHSEVNVIARFDPDTENMPALIFDVNSVNKLREKISRAENPKAETGCVARGYCQIFNPDDPNARSNGTVTFSSTDPFVRNLLEDRLWEKDRQEIIMESLKKEFRRESIEFDPPVPSESMFGEQNPDAALSDFLRFCRTHYPARNYILFILGHGLVVGNDVFLFDEDAKEHSLSLAQLGRILGTFKQKLDEGDEFQLISFHSCSMSGLEVAYELKGAVNYMLASQCDAFVGSWTYLQMLVRLFKDVEHNFGAEDNSNGDGHRGGASPEAIKDMLKKFWAYCFYNSYDFRLAGFSFDVTLCDLNKLKEPEGAIKDGQSAGAAISKLATVLGKALADPLAQERILLAHWDAQSFWKEHYTDLYDFCFCLKNRCGVPAEKETKKTFRAMMDACDDVTRALSCGDDELVVRSKFTGPTYQYSRGLSVFFPWSAPTNTDFWPATYEEYEFNKATGWGEFLEAYFEQTMRKPRGAEPDSLKAASRRLGVSAKHPNRFEIRDRLNEDLLDGVLANSFNGNGRPAGGPAGARLGEIGPRDPLGEIGPRDPVGDIGPRDPVGDGGCECPSIKNYPPFTSARAGLDSGACNSPAAKPEPAPTQGQPRADAQRPRKGTNGSGAEKPAPAHVSRGRGRRT